MTLNRIEIAVLIKAVLSVISASALYAAPSPISFEVRDRNGVLGEVNMRVFSESKDWYEEVLGEFKVTRRNENGATMTVKELEEKLGLRFNWFQIVTRDADPPNDSNGRQLEVPYIDPPRNGYEDYWSDDRPWYFDEFRRPPGEPRDWDDRDLLDNRVSGSILGFEDAPRGYIDDEFEFRTFLVASDSQSKIYDVLGGFSWSAKVENDGFTDIITWQKNESARERIYYHALTRKLPTHVSQD